MLSVSSVVNIVYNMIIKIMRNLFLLLVVFFFVDPVAAQVPDIGDNSVFYCDEEQDELGCFGNIFWVAKRRTVRLARARRIAKVLIRRAKRRKRKTCRRGKPACSSWTTQLANLQDTRADLITCWNYEDDTCTGDGGDDDDGTTNPAVAEACSVAADPTNAAERSLLRTTFKPRIANGAICSSATNSPIVAVLNDGEPSCTGTLIASNIVLTAAHCFDGIGCEATSVATQGGTEISASSCIQHPDWTDGSTNDVAIVRLSSSFSGVTPVAIHRGSVSEGTRAVLAGFGDNEDRDNNLRATFNTIDSVTSTSISTFYQVGDSNQGTTCVGDSGSGLFIFVDGVYKTIGTLSGGGPSDCATADSGATEDTSDWANITSTSNLNFIDNNS